MDSYPKAKNVKIQIYDKKENYLVSQNPSQTLYTDEKGYASVNYDSKKVIWFRISRDTLNGERSSFNNNSTFSGSDFGGQNSGTVGMRKYSDFKLLLSNTPTKLKLEVYKSGALLKNADIRLYFSEADRDIKRRYKYTDKETWAYSGSKPEGYFVQETNDNGIVEFNGLEPRKYWFTVKPIFQSNEIIPLPVSTNGSLEANPELTNTLQISIP